MVFFFFNDTATTEIYTLSLHDALPISRIERANIIGESVSGSNEVLDIREFCFSRNGYLPAARRGFADRKSTRLNSSHANISYAVFCLNKKTSSTCDHFSLTPQYLKISL